MLMLCCESSGLKQVLCSFCNKADKKSGLSIVARGLLSKINPEDIL